MLVLNEAFEPIDRLHTILWRRVEHDRLTTVTRLLGRLVAYVPNNAKAYYKWTAVVSYRPSQHISVYQISPAQLRIVLFSCIELGFILDHWLLGLRLGKPLAWVRRLQPA